MSVTLSPVGGVAAQFFSNDGVPLAGGLIYTYLAGTNTPAATYTSAAGSIVHSNPIVLDSSGRVPTGEIWLTDSTSYKFVLKDASNVLIATYDNIIGINSNYVNFFAQEEIQTATAGQTVFTLVNPYVPGANTLSVFVDGVNQYSGSTYSYVETSANTVTFDSGLHVGALVKFTTVQSLTSGQQTDAALVTYNEGGTGAVTTTVRVKLQETISVTDFGATGNGVTDDTAAIQAAHAAAVTAGNSLGFAEVVFPAGTYVFSNLTWSPMVGINCLGTVILKSSITTGKGIHVSTLYGNWNTVPKQLAYNSNAFVHGGKFIIENTTGSGGNTATGIFFGDDGSAAYSAESLALYNVYLRGWNKSHRFGTHAYLITFISSQFRYNGDAIFNDLGSYVDRCERMTYINCTFAQNTNVITGDTNCSGDFSFIGCSMDYNTQILPNITQAMVINVTGGSHIETNTATPFFTVAGGSLNLDGYYVAWLGVGSGPVPIIAKVGASGLVTSRGMAALTPTGATLFELTSVTAVLEADDFYRQFGGPATSYITNTGNGYVDQQFSAIAANAFLLGARGNVKVRATGVYTHEFTKTGVAAAATVDLFSVGPSGSYASGRMTIQATSAGLITVKIVDFVLIGAGTAGGTNVTATENYSGGASAFTVSETINSPSAGYNKLSVTNNSGATCSFTVSVQINYLSTGGFVTPL